MYIIQSHPTNFHTVFLVFFGILIIQNFTKDAQNESITIRFLPLKKVKVGGDKNTTEIKKILNLNSISYIH